MIWQPDLVEDAPAQGGGELDWMIFEGPFQPRPFCESMFL